MKIQKCPICNGTGTVSGGFYDHPEDCSEWASNHTTEVCRQCKGTGLITIPEISKCS